MASAVLKKFEKEIEAHKKKASRKKSKGKMTTPLAIELTARLMDQDPTNKGNYDVMTNVLANNDEEEESGDEAFSFHVAPMIRMTTMTFGTERVKRINEQYVEGPHVSMLVVRPLRSCSRWTHQ
jgi:hypothetical protein